MTKHVRNFNISLALLLGAALAAMAANAPKLQIQSPSENASIQAPAGSAGVVSIKFKTDHFKVISLKDAAALNTSQNQSAPSVSAADNNSSTSNAGTMGRTTEPSAPGASSAAGNQPMSESLPQSDANAAAPKASGNPNEGFIDVNVDGSAWHFLHSNSDAIMLAGLAPGAHKVSLQLLGSDFRPVGTPQAVDFTVASAPAK